MEPVRYNIRIYQNASWQLETTFRDPQGAALDLTTYSAEMMIRRKVPTEDVLLTLDSDAIGGIVLSNSYENNMVIRISRSQTSALPTQNRDIEDWVYDLKLWETADKEYTTVRLLEGEVNVSPAVTRQE